MNGKRTLIVTIALLVMFVTSGWAATIEVSGATHMTANAEYDRNPSIVYDTSDYWLFWTKGDDTSTAGVRGGTYNPDADTYVIYYKTAGTLAGLAGATETKLLLSDTGRPAGFDQRVVSATYFGGDIYAFASSGQSGTDKGLYYYKWDGAAWTGPITLIADATAQGGHVNVTSDASYVYIVWEATADASSDCYTWDGTTLNVKIDISTDNQPKIALDGTTLYVVSIEDGTGDIEAHSAAAGVAPVFSSHSTPVPVGGFYDPCIVSDGTDLHVITAPWLSGTDQQYLIETVYSGGSWSAANTMTMGGYGTTYWWDYWPVAYYDGSDVYVFFTTETASPSYSDGEIAMLKMDWDLANDHYLYVQNAVDEALSGDDLAIAAGTYREQLKIDGKNLDLVGAGIGSTIVEAVDLVDRTTYSIIQWTSPPTPRTIDACIGVTGAGTVNISDMTVDGRQLGPADFYGIHFFDTSGSVTGCRIEDILYPAVPSDQKVVSVVATQSAAAASYTVDFSDNVVPNFQKGGILVMGPDMTFTVNDNDIVNAPSDYNAGNGIQLSYGATGTTSGNTVRGIAYTGEDWAATGILLFESGDVSMNGDEVYECESAVNFSDWGWIYLHPSQVALDFAGLNLHDNDWPLGVQLSRDGSDVDIDITDCLVTDSTGDGIDLFGTGVDPWGGSYYTGWDNGSLVARILDCVITNTTIDGIWVDDLSGNATNSMDVSVHQTALSGNTGSALWNGQSDEVDAEYCWWGDPAGPTVIPEPPRGNRPAAADVSPYGADLPERGEPRYVDGGTSRAGDGVHGLVDYTPWLAGNIVCDPDPLDLVVGSTTGTIDVDYLGGGVGLLYGYSVTVTWDVAKATLTGVTQGSLLSDAGVTNFFVSGSGGTRTIDCALTGGSAGVTGPGTLFTLAFSAVGSGTSTVDLGLVAFRDNANNPLAGFYEDDGLINVDVTDPVFTDVSIANLTLGHTDDYAKNTDNLQLTADVTDDYSLSVGDIVADLSGLLTTGGSAVVAESYGSGVATWTTALANVTLTADGVQTVTVTATDWLGNSASDSDGIIVDNTAPGTVSGLDAAPAHEEVVLSWDDASGAPIDYYGVMVRYDVWGDYPLYDLPDPAPYPADETEGVLAFSGVGTGTTFGVVPRDIHYFSAFVYDWALNYGTVTAAGQDRATNYWLGDVANVANNWTPDGLVTVADIVKLSTLYGGAPSGNELTCDVGPTDDNSRVGIPEPDDLLNFEDLMIFAMNYGVVAAKVVPFLGEPGAGDLALALVENGRSDGGVLELALRLEGNAGDVKGLTAELEFDGLEFLSARLSDEMSSPLADMFFWSNATSRSVQVDAAVLGTDVTIGGSGDVVVFSFQVLDETYAVDFASAKLRGAANEDLTAEFEGLSFESVPVAFKLVQNSPNPFNPVTKVAYHVPHESRVTIRVFDVTGRLVMTLVDGVVEPGRHSAVWNGTNDRGESVGSGVYFCTMETPDYRDSHKMTLLK